MDNINEAIILAGGKGTRLRSVTLNQIPKALVDIKGKSILEWELIWLSKYKIKRVILAIGHLSEKIEEKIGRLYTTKYGEVELIYSNEKEKLGSGGGVKLASKFLENERFIILNGDILTNIDLGEVIKIHFKIKGKATMALVKMRSPYGVVETKGDYIAKFIEKPLLPVLIHSGIDICEKEVISRFPDKGQMEDTIFKELADEGSFAFYTAPESSYWRSIDTQKDFDNANSDWLPL